MSTPTRIISIVTAIEAVESRLDACPTADVTPRMRAVLNRLLCFPTLRIELPESYHPDYPRLLAADTASFDRNRRVMENFLFTFFDACEARGAMSDTAWLETLHGAMRDHLRVWFRTYSLEITPDAPGSPVETGDWSLERLIAVYQLAQVADPADPSYRPPTLGFLLVKTARYA
jgi:hypothetical protein